VHLEKAGKFTYLPVSRLLKMG